MSGSFGRCDVILKTILIFYSYLCMIFQVYVGKRPDSRGRVEVSLRFRHGRVDQQAATNLWVLPESVASEEYVSARGRQACRYVFTDEGDVAVGELLDRMKAYVEECFCLVRRKGVGVGWLADTLACFNASVRPRIEEARSEVLELIDAYMLATSTVDSSESRRVAYGLMRRSAARFEAFKRLKDGRFKLVAERMDDVCLRDFESFMRQEHLYVKRFPRIAKGVGLEGRTLPKGQNTVNDRMKLLKAVMNWGVRTRRIAHNPFDSFSRGRNVYGSPIYLTIDERRRIENHDFSHDPRLALQRDIFVFQCCVGCRVSDLSCLTAGNIVNGELNYVARKTRQGHPVTIKVPLNRTARGIVERYADVGRQSLFPRVYSRVGYNVMIKRILKEAGIKRRVMVVDPLTREPVNRRLYEVASSHLARRTFIGNIFKRFKDQSIVGELSGHAPGSHAFARYREIDGDMRREMVDTVG